MPYVKITVTRKDITAGQKRKLFEGVTRLLVEVLDKEPDLTHIVIEEVDPENWGVGGKPSLEYRKARGESGKAASHG